MEQLSENIGQLKTQAIVIEFYKAAVEKFRVQID